MDVDTRPWMYTGRPRSSRSVPDHLNLNDPHQGSRVRIFETGIVREKNSPRWLNQGVTIENSLLDKSG